jgi:flagellar biosynthesis regulator FlaF
MGSKVLVAGARATSELDDEALAHEIGTMESRNDITSIHGVLVLDETETVHQLDLSNFASAVSLEVAFDVCLGGITGKVA